MEAYNLVAAVTNILNKKVTEEQAKEFALSNFGELCAHIRARHISYIFNSKKKRAIDMRTNSGRPKTRVFGSRSVKHLQD